jgi:hypothetical protein
MAKFWEILAVIGFLENPSRIKISVGVLLGLAYLGVGSKVF